MYLVTVVKEFYSESPGCEVAGLFTTPENAALAKEKVEAYLTKEEYEDFQVFVSFMEPDHLAYYEMEETIATAPVMKEGSYTSVWDDGTTLVSRCIVNERKNPQPQIILTDFLFIFCTMITLIRLMFIPGHRFYHL